MRLEGTHTLDAPVDKVWNLMLDPDILAKITPGIKSLEPIGEGKFKAISDVKLGPVSGSFKGDMEVTDLDKPNRFTLKMKQNSKIGNVAAVGHIELKAVNGNQTEVVFSGDAKLSGTLARTGQRVLSGVARTLTNQFFQSLEEELVIAGGGTVEKVSMWARFMAWLRKLFSKSSK